MDIIGKFSNIDAWVHLLLLLVIVGLVFNISKLATKANYETSPIKKRNLIRNTLVNSAILLLIVFFFFLYFGKGEPTIYTPVEETGEYQDIYEAEDEDSPEEIERQAEEMKTDELRIQSNDSLRDEYLKESEKKSGEAIEKYLNN